MATVKRIIHLSDLHIGFEDLEQRFIKLVDMLAILKSEKERYVVVITGDITEAATKEFYAKAADCIDYLRQFCHKVLIAPGNHDYAVGILHAKKKVKEFKDAFLEGYQGTYPKVDIVGEQGEDKIAFIALDSLEGELKGLQSFGADGEIGKPQLKRLAEILESAKVRDCACRVIYLHHHPLYYAHELHGWIHDLKDIKKLQDVILGYQLKYVEKPISAILFGHEHSRKTYPGIWNGAAPLCVSRAYDGGSSTRKGNIPCIHRIIDFSREARLDYDADFLRGYPVP